MGSNTHKFEKVVGRLPISNDKLIGLGMQFFLSQQDPEEVEFVRHPNGYSIQVKTDQKNIEDAETFWSQHVSDDV